MAHQARPLRLDYEALFRQAPAGYALTLDDGTIVDVNDTFLEWTGLTRSGVQGTSLLNLFSAGDRSKYFAQALPRLQASSAVSGLAVDLLVSAGRRHPVLLTATRSIPADGQPSIDRIILVKSPEQSRPEAVPAPALRTIAETETARTGGETKAALWEDELRRKDRALQKSLLESRRNEALLQTILDTVDVGVAVVDTAGRTVLENARHKANVRLATPGNVELPEEADLLVFRPDRTTPVPATNRILPRLALGESFTDELIWIGPPEHQRALSVSGRTVKDVAFQGSVLAFGDVTRLVEATAAKQDFVANVSHELRTPLTSIIGYLDLVLDKENLPAPIEASLRVIMRNCDRLMQLILDLLSTAAGPGSIEPEAIDLVEIITASIESAALRAQAHNVRITQACPEPIEADVDPFRIGQVLDNLLSNAIKYSPHGGDVTVSASQRQGHIVIQVADTGMGMTPQEQGEVFTKFFRSRSVLKAAIPGAGLGLTITRNIVEAHQGTITVDSEPGRGTIFTVTLPATQAGRQHGNGSKTVS